MVGHAADEADATHFIPVDSKGTPGKVIIKGVEDDEYIITEVRTDNGYTLLKEAITVAISQKASSQLCDCYSRDALGLIQNDPRYACRTGEIPGLAERSVPGGSPEPRL